MAEKEYIERNRIKYEQWSVGPLNAPLMVVRKETIDSIPAADVVEVVRCEKCKHRSEKLYTGDYLCNKKMLGRVRSTDFCSFGERKDGGGNGG